MALSELTSMQSLEVPLGSRSYPIWIGTPAAQGLALAWRKSCPDPSRFVVIADQKILSIAHKTINSLGLDSKDVALLEVPSGEESKSIQELQRLWRRMASLRADRKTVVVAVGGGVIGDLAGFLAASWNRGVRFIQIPTTLLAMVDSSVGGKTGINLPEAKNVIGAFWQPKMVWIDLANLDSLPPREYTSGLAEVVKYGVIMDAEFFGWLEANSDAVLRRDGMVLTQLVRRCCELKARVVVEDEHETTGLRAILNYGHTYGHAIESLAHYGTYLHGEAVSIGMTMAGRLAVALGRWSNQELSRQTALLEAFALPTRLGHHHERLAPETIIQAMQLDKKTSHGRINLILPNRIGHVETVSNASLEQIVSSIESS